MSRCAVFLLVFCLILIQTQNASGSAFNHFWNLSPDLELELYIDKETTRTDTVQIYKNNLSGLKIKDVYKSLWGVTFPSLYLSSYLIRNMTLGGEEIQMVYYIDEVNDLSNLPWGERLTNSTHSTMISTNEGIRISPQFSDKSTELLDYVLDLKSDLEFDLDSSPIDFESPTIKFNYTTQNTQQWRNPPTNKGYGGEIVSPKQWMDVFNRGNFTLIKQFDDSFAHSGEIYTLCDQCILKSRTKYTWNTLAHLSTQCCSAENKRFFPALQEEKDWIFPGQWRIYINNVTIYHQENRNILAALNIIEFPHFQQTFLVESHSNETQTTVIECTEDNFILFNPHNHTYMEYPRSIDTNVFINETDHSVSVTVV